MKKKLLSFLLASVMTLSMGTAAFAEGDPTVSAPPTYTDTTSVDLKLNYKLDGFNTETPGLTEKMKSPEETITFTIEKEAVTDSLYTKDNMPEFDSNLTTPGAQKQWTTTLSKGFATLDGAEETVSVPLPTYDKVGVFTYKVTMEGQNKAGVEYDSTPVWLKVTVLQEESGLVRQVRMYHGNALESAVKGEGFKNVYKSNEVDFTKNVTGNLGDKQKYFAVDVTLTKAEDEDVPADVVYEESFVVTGGTKIEDGKKDCTASTIKFGETKAFYVKADDTIHIENLPYGVTWTIAEQDYTGDGYKAPAYSLAENSKGTIGDKNVTGTIDDAIEDEVTITNNKDKEVDTGVLQDSLPYVLMLALVAAGVVAFFVMKRRSYEI